VRCTDPAFGELVWDQNKRAWTGTLSFRGRAVRLELHPDEVNPTAAERQAIIDLWRGLPARLPAMEPELRRRAAEDVAGDADIRVRERTAPGRVRGQPGTAFDHPVRLW
jgi:hypothetical protein